MSERAFFLVPSDPYYLPDKGRRARFLDFFKEVSPLPNANGEYYCHVYDQPQPIDAGEGFEAVVCPSCDTRLTLYNDDGWTSNHEWWQAALRGPRDAMVTTPCCGAKARVADLRFYANGAFARFAVGALEPSDSDFWEDEGPTLRVLEGRNSASIRGNPGLSSAPDMGIPLDPAGPRFR